MLNFLQLVWRGPSRPCIAGAGHRIGRSPPKAWKRRGGPAQADPCGHEAERIGRRRPVSVDDPVKVGQAATLVIQFDNITDPAGGSARFTADTGLTLVGAEEVRLPAGQATTVTVRATPASEGIAYVNVFTTQNGMSSATSIPVRVGEAAAKLRSTATCRRRRPATQ